MGLGRGLLSLGLEQYEVASRETRSMPKFCTIFWSIISAS
jgi:hypothetical protein